MLLESGEKCPTTKTQRWITLKSWVTRGTRQPELLTVQPSSIHAHRWQSFRMPTAKERKKKDTSRPCSHSANAPSQHSALSLLGPPQKACRLEAEVGAGEQRGQLLSF